MWREVESRKDEKGREEKRGKWDERMKKRLVKRDLKEERKKKKVKEMKEGRRNGAGEELFLAFQGTLCQRVPPPTVTFIRITLNLLHIIQIPVLLPEILDLFP